MSIKKINDVFSTEFGIPKDILPSKATFFEAKYPYYLGPSFGGWMNSARSAASLLRTRKQISLYGLYKSKANLGVADLKNLFALFSEDIFSKTIDMNKIFFSVSQQVRTSATLKQDKWEGNVKFTTPSKEQVLKDIIKPLLAKWVANNIKTEDLTLLYNKWLKTESNNAKIIEEISAISSGNHLGYHGIDSYFLKPVGPNTFSWQDSAQYFAVPIFIFFNDLFAGTSGLDKVKIKAFMAEDLAENNTFLDISMILGFDEAIDEGIGGSLDSNTVDDDGNAIRSARQLEEALKTSPELFAKVAAGVQGAAYKAPTAEELISLRQCALITRLLHDDANKIQFSNYFNNANFANSPLNAKSESTGHERIYSVDPAYDPNQFYNRCHISRAAKDTFNVNSSEDTQKQNSLWKKLYWVFSTDDGLKEIEIPLSSEEKHAKEANLYYKYLRAKKAFISGVSAAEAIATAKRILGPKMSKAGEESSWSEAEITTRLNPPKEKKADVDSGATYYFLNDIEIKYEGTTPATARNDVQVQISFTLSSMQALQNVVATIPKSVTKTNSDVNISLYDLITLPSTGQVSGGPGSYLANQYSPEYSRIRLKAFTGDGNKCDLIIDLSVIDHSISRESETGKTTLVINYRGFFEAMMNMPFNDALADDATLKKREGIHKDAMKIIKTQDCTPELINKAMRVEQEIFRRETKELSAMSLLTRLSSKKLIHGYTVNEAQIKARAVNGSIDAFQDYVTKVISGGGVISSDEATTVKESAQAKRDKKETDAKDLSSIKNKFFFLGDLLYMVSGCLYVGDTTTMREFTKNLNMRFMIGSINVPNPKTRDGSKITINPVCIPIDVAYFVEWFNSVIVNKGITTYPVGIFIKELIERLVNNIVFEVCMSSLLPTENPPVIRSTFISNFEEKGWFKKNTNGWFDPDNPYAQFPGRMVPRKNTTNPLLTEEPSQNSSTMQAQNRSKQLSAAALGFGDVVYKSSIEKGNLFKKDAEVNLDTLANGVYDTNPYNYCIIYQQYPTFSEYTTRDSTQKLRNTNYVPTILYGAKNTSFNYASSVSFSKTDSPMLREARYFNSNYGNLSLLANVYDLSFSFIRRKASTFLYPGIIINFGLIDWDIKEKSGSPYKMISNNAAARNKEPHEDDYTALGQNNPHSPKTIAHILGFGGYYIIKAVTYKLGQTIDDFEISITTKFMGTDAIKKGSRGGEETPKLEDKQACVEAYNELVERVNSFSGEDYEPPATIKTVVEDDSATPNEERTSERAVTTEFSIGGETYSQSDTDPDDLPGPATTNTQKFQEILNNNLSLTVSGDGTGDFINYEDLNSDDLNSVIDLIIGAGITEVALANYQTSSGKRLALSVQGGNLYNGSSMVRKK